MFRIKHLRIDTLSEHVIFIHEAAVRTGNLGFRPLDRVRVVEATPTSGLPREVVTKGEPLFEIHAQSEAQLEFGRAYAEAHPAIVRFGF